MNKEPGPRAYAHSALHSASGGLTAASARADAACTLVLSLSSGPFSGPGGVMSKGGDMTWRRPLGAL